MACMIFEIRSIEDYNLTEIIIIDLNNIALGHAVKYTLPVIKKLELSVIVSSRKYIRTPLIRKQLSVSPNIRIVLALPVNIFLL
jgi:hypothetical protein